MAADLRGANLIKSTLTRANLSRSNLTGATLVGANLRDANLSEANLSNANLQKVDLCGADLRGARLHEAMLSEADLTGARLGGANFKRANLCGALLNGAKLAGMNFREIEFRGALLRGAYLNGASLHAADLRGADLTKARLDGADLSGADLSGADLSGANLTEADLSGSNLREANFDGVIVGRTVFGDVDLHEAKGLNEVEHKSPSTIGIDTIIASRVDIPEAFLRRAGVPEPFIVEMKSLVGAIEPIELYSCLISYAAEDREFAERLKADLQDEGVRCWSALHGKTFRRQIGRLMPMYDRLVIVLSEASINSEWVKADIAMAKKEEARQGRIVLFPVSLLGSNALHALAFLDSNTDKECEHDTGESFIPNFSNYEDDDSYEKALDLLLESLNAENGTSVR